MTEETLKKLFDAARWQSCPALDEIVGAVGDKYPGAFQLPDDELDVWAAGDPSAYFKDGDDDR